MSISNCIAGPEKLHPFPCLTFFWITNRFREKFKYIFKNWNELEFLVFLEYYLLLDKKDLRKYIIVQMLNSLKTKFSFIRYLEFFLPK